MSVSQLHSVITVHTFSVLSHTSLLNSWLQFSLLASLVISLSQLCQAESAGSPSPGKNCLSESESYVTTDGQSASLSWKKAPIWGLDQILLLSDGCGFVEVGRYL
jgi:hypothetical protein